MKHIVCFHLFNDYSGSPKVLKTVLEGLLEKGYHVDLVSSKGGILDELSHPHLRRRFTYRYRFSTNAAITMFRYILVQIYTFLISWYYLFDKDAVFYINTILPTGPATAGRLMGKKVVYHYHENAFVKGAFYRTLAWWMQKIADRIICVSAYQASFLKRKTDVTVVPNALPKDFVERLHPNAEEAFKRKTVLMLSSLKEYKGTREFIQLASDMPQYHFVLVINDSQENVDNYLKDIIPLHNLSVYPRQQNVEHFYHAATMVICLTNRHLAIETFGMTTLEAMSCGLPVIVPTVGGIAEMVDDAENGFKIDVQHLEVIKQRIADMMTDQELYARLSANAWSKSQKFMHTSDWILEIFNNRQHQATLD